ncbi:hypothetical protein MSAN_00839700 [Mycena sanguinolenta]|uniref:Glycosyl transferase family 25 domain-containing protein n=1 Tax=Mycena sanguinolenta TaxID=230812 RepID=A0A8H6YYY4_9AGAR|nr:hypothetical protein MSAN_00839700 [Mycena sanguinolenta]
MSPAPPRSFTVIVGAVILLVIYAHTNFSLTPASFRLGSLPDQHHDRAPEEVLPVPSQTYVISLPRRRDRYADMERLRTRLGVRWTYAVAEDAQSPLVDQILTQVRTLRQNTLQDMQYLPNTTVTLPFEWPSTDISTSHVSSQNPALERQLADSDSERLTCATGNFTLPPYSAHLPEYKILSRSRIACWHSHLSVIRRVSTAGSDKTATLILEDDIDMEADIKERLSSIWSLLPADWDIVFFGCVGALACHCWSNESYYPALEYTLSRQSTPLSTAFHPSHAPLCTHAYALSPAGAKRLLLHLTYPPFAYSRAIDHALAWLVRSGRLKAFSVLPSVVVQRKIGKSDVMLGDGSEWRDHLVHGVLANGDFA